MEGKLRILLTIGVIFAFLSGNAFAGNDCTFTPNPSGWQFPYDNVAYRLQAERTWINIPIAHVQVQPTSSSWEHQGSLKVFVNGNAVTLYGDYDLQNSIGTSFDYLAGSGNIDFGFILVMTRIHK